MNVYKVILSCEHHYGNDYVQRENESRKIVAKDGDAAVRKAKKEVASNKPILEGLECVLIGVK